MLHRDIDALSSISEIHFAAINGWKFGGRVQCTNAIILLKGTEWRCIFNFIYLMDVRNADTYCPSLTMKE